MRFLIIDNDPLFLDLVCEVVELYGVEVSAAKSCTDAFAAMAAGDEFDVVLTDVELGGRCSGIDVAIRMSQEHPDTAIVLMSGMRPEAVEQLFPAGISFPLLPKPFRIPDLTRVVEVACPGALQLRVA